MAKAPILMALMAELDKLMAERCAPAAETPIRMAPAPYVTIPLAATITGLTEKAIRRKIEDGKWIEGREYRRSPDGGVFISVAGFARWVEGGVT